MRLKQEKLIYGCMGLGGEWDTSPVTKADQQQANTVLDEVLGLGILHFDHADIYRYGKSEQVFGYWLKEQKQLRESLYIQSKVGIQRATTTQPGQYNLSARWVQQQVEMSLRQLQTDYLDCLLLHRPDPLVDMQELAHTIQQLHQSGKIRSLGVSNMNYQQIHWLKQNLTLPIVANQIEMSLRQHQWLNEGVHVYHTYGAQENSTPGTIEYCQEHHIQLQAWGALAQGYYQQKELPERDQLVATLLIQLAEQYITSVESILLAWLLRHPAAINPIIGTINKKRIQACVQARSLTLEREHWYALYVAARGQPLP